MARKKAKKPHPAIVYLRNTGGGLSVLGLMGILPFPQFYWYGVGTLCVGLAALVIEALVEDWPIVYRLLLCAFLVAVAVLFLTKVVYVSAPLDVAITIHNGDYADHANIYGIEWEPGLSEIRIILANHTSYDYDDVDISFTPNIPTRAVTQVTNLPDVNLAVEQNLGTVDVSGVELSGRDKDGKVVDGENPTRLYASSRGFRMRCPKLPKHSTMDLLVAVVMPNAQPSGTSTNAIISLYGTDVRQFAGPKTLASTLYMKGQYTVLNRPHTIENGYAVKGK